MKVIKIDTDVAIIGGGTAGLNAAMAAAKEGVSVVVVEKAHINRSGAIAGGIDHFLAYLESGDPWDTREEYLKYVAKVAKGAVNMQVHEKVYCDELRSAIKRIEQLGISLKDPVSGVFYRTQAMGQPGPYFINFNGKKLKPYMAQEVLKLGCQVLNRVQVTKLYLYDGEIAGFSGFNVRRGDFYTIRSKAIIIATGNTNRMFHTQTGNPFNIWYCPACTGDLHRAALEIGVELANMEYIRMTIVPKGFSAPGFNAFFGMGAHLINALGERFMERYHPMGEKAPRNYVVWGVLEEIRQGRGPIYIDCRHLSEKDKKHLFITLGYDKDTLPDFLIKKGYDLSTTLIEVTVSEPMQARPSELCGSGIKINETCASNIPGLFAAGDCSDQMGCLHMAVTGGYRAGRYAAKYAKNIKSYKPLVSEEVAEEHYRVFRPLEKKRGVSYWEFEEILRNITTSYFVPAKNEISLKTAIEKLNKLDSIHSELTAKSFHELMRVHEAISIQQIAKVTAISSLARKETRFLPYHYRTDFPKTDDTNFCGLIVVKKDSDGRLTTRFEPLSYNSYL